MTPFYSVVVNGTPITDLIAPILRSMTITDEAGTQSDSLRIELADEAARLELPPKGAVLVVSLGYREEGLDLMGEFTVDAVGLVGPPDVVTIDGKAVPMTADRGAGIFQERKTRSFEAGTTLGALARQIAGEQGLEPQIAPTLDGIALPHVDQTDESDANLLTRLARENGATFKAAAGKLILVPKGQGLRSDGTPIEPVTLRRSDVSRYELRQQGRTVYRSVITTYHDAASGQPVEQQAGAAKPVFRDRKVYPDADAAMRAAQSQLDDFLRSGNEVTVTLAGRTTLRAEGVLVLEGFRPELNGRWNIRRVEHAVSRSGYRTSITAEAPK